MFTGLIQHLGEVCAAEPSSAGLRLSIDPCGWSHRPALGESIAVNGCCLTVTRSQADVLVFDAVSHTLERTTIGRLRPGDRVNLEHAATPATLLGGHIVQGHIDGVGAATRTERLAAGEVRLRIESPEDMIPFITPRGSIAIDGVSLTIARVDDASFDVVLIPTTLELTNLGRIDERAQPVNLETDCLVRAVVHYLNVTRR